MQVNSKSNNQGDPDHYNVTNPTVGSGTWWEKKNISGYNNNLFNPGIMRGNAASDSSSLGESVDGQSQSEDANLDQVAPTSRPTTDGSHMRPPQLDLVGPTIACASNPYDPYYGGMVAAYGQPLVPNLYDYHQSRMPLPLEMAEEPVYVNAKQYHGILRRRQSRAKAELEKKLIKVRKPYLHESRHQHAMKRARASGGRFAKKSDANTSTLSSSQSISSSVTEVPDSQYLYNNPKGGNSRNKGELGPTSSHQWGNVQSNRALAMQ